MFPRISPIATSTASVLVGTHNLLCGYERPVKVCKGIVKDCPSFRKKSDAGDAQNEQRKLDLPGLELDLFRRKYSPVGST